MRRGTSTGEVRLALYRRAARALNRFYARWTSSRCADCLALIRNHHRGDPRADVDLVTGIFPGCCHAGVADALWIPGGERFPDSLREAMVAARTPLRPEAEPLSYEVQERSTGRVVRGVACVHLGAAGCRLGDLKGPLCLGYLCEPVRRELAASGGGEWIGADTDDFCGAKQVTVAVASGPRRTAERAVRALERRLARLDRCLERSGPSGSPRLSGGDEGGANHG